MSQTPCMVNQCALRPTFCLASLSNGVHLIAFIAFTFKIALVVDADLATSVRVLTLVDVCREERKQIINQLRHKQPVTATDSFTLMNCWLTEIQIQ